MYEIMDLERRIHVNTLLSTFSPLVAAHSTWTVKSTYQCRFPTTKLKKKVTCLCRIGHACALLRTQYSVRVNQGRARPELMPFSSPVLKSLFISENCPFLVSLWASELIMFHLTLDDVVCVLEYCTQERCCLW